MIIAVNDAGYIGLNNQLPWQCSEDLKHFKKVTMGCKLLVGRKTYETLPPLKGRELIVVGQGHNTLEEALAQKPDWVIGGAKIYESTLHLCDELHISRINDDTVGDTKWIDICDYIGEIHEYNFEVNN